MTATNTAVPTREVVGTFADREHFQAAVDALFKAGFARTDLSVLSSHDSIDAAGLVAAGVGGVAAKELLDEVAALPDSDEFAKALAAGSVVLWVAAADSAREERARAILHDSSAQNIHVFERKRR